MTNKAIPKKSTQTGSRKQKTLLITVFVAYAAFVVLGLYDGLLGVAWLSMRTTFGVPIDALGLLLLAGTAGHVTASFANGSIIARRGIRFALLSSCVLMVAGLLTETVAPEWAVLVAGGFVAGLGRGMMDAGMNTFASANFRPRLLNWLHASFGVGTTAGALLMTGLLAASFGWRAGLAIITAWNGALLIAFLITRRLWVLENGASDSAETTPSAPYKSTLRLPIVWLSIGVFFLYTGIELGVGQWSFTVFTESRGLSETVAGLWTTLYWGSLTIGRILLGFIETRIATWIRIALFTVVAGMIIVLLNVTPWLNLLGLMIVGFSLAPVFPFLITLTPVRMGAANAPNAIGFQVGAAGVGAAILPATAGVLGADFGLETIMVFMTVAAILMWLLHELIVYRVAAKTAAANH
ncbi:MAG: MFS transporter [Anaerolineae bacterium]|nr:MFS transporter [Anaerolineae bacterium]